MLNSLIVRTRSWWGWLLFVLAAALLVPHVIVSMFWAPHDKYDDTGYALSVLRSLAHGDKLYDEVVSQYGPFFNQAWLLLLRCCGGVIDHNHAAVVAALLWLFSAGSIAWCVKRVTGSAWWAFAAALWCAWSLNRIASELGHPKSLIAALCSIALIGLCLKNRRRGAIVAGAAIAALTMTKVNLGVFALVAVALGSWSMMAKRRWLVIGAGLASVVLPLQLLHKAWPTEPMLLLGLAVWIPTVMMMQITAAKVRPESAVTREEWIIVASFTGSFAIFILLIGGMAWHSGTSLTSLIDGILLRPLMMRDVLEKAPELGSWEIAVVAASALLALLWQVRPLRQCTLLWQGAMATAVGAELGWDVNEGTLWHGCLTAPALLWLALAAHDQEGEKEHGLAQRWLIFAALLAVWQSLGTFPTFGSQTSLPRFLIRGVWITALGIPLARQAGASMRISSMLSIARCLIVLAGLCLLTSDTIGNARFRFDKFVAVPLRGTTWHHWRAAETTKLVGVTANLEQCTGPVFSFHGQDSLAIWAGKRVIDGHSSPHYLARYRPPEIDRSLLLFRETASWSAVVFAQGGVYPRGNAQSGMLWNQINDFVAEKTRPWLQIGNYEIRLSTSAPEPQPVNVVWKNHGRWQMNAPAQALRSALKARLRTNGRIAGNFSWHAMEPTAVLAVPDDIARVLESARTTDDASLWLCDGKWTPLAMLPVAKLLLK